MVSKNNLHLKQTKTADQTPHYGLRKLSIGVASVLLSTTLYLGATAQADTVPTGDESQSPATSAVADSSSSTAGTLTIAQNAGSTADTQSATDSATSQAGSAASNAGQTAEPAVSASPVSESAADDQNTPASNASQTAESAVSASPASESTVNSQNAPVSSVARSANQAAKPAVNTFSVSDLAATMFDLSPSATDLVTDSALTASLATRTAADTTTNVETPDVSKWTYNVVPNGTANEIVLTGYTGTDSTIIVPNAVDFANAGVSISNGTVYLTYDLARKLATTIGATKLIVSNNGDAKVVACGNNYSANSLIIGDADWHGAFQSSAFSSMDLRGLDTSQVTNMSSMFADCSNLTSLDVSNWDTSKVTDMYGMFLGCSNLASLNVSNWDTSKVTDMHYMFEGSNLASLDVSNWDTSKVTDMYGMFGECNNLTSLDLSNWNTSNVTDMYCMFYSCNNLTSLDLSNWDTSNVIDMGTMFYVESYVPLEVITKDSKLLAYDYASDNRVSKIQFNANADDATLSSNNAQTDSKTLTVAFTPEQAKNSTLTSKIDQLADDSTNNYQQLAKTYQATIKANPGLSAELAAAFDAVSNESATRPNYGLGAFNPTNAMLGQAATLTSLLNGTYTAEWKKAAKSTVEFVDDDNNGAVVGTPVVLSGYADDVKSVALPANYELVSGQTIPTSVTLSGANDTVQIHLKHQIQNIADNDPMNHTSFQVTVHYKKNGVTNTFMPDTVITTKYKRTTTKDLVTGKYTATPFVLESISQTGTKIDGLGTPTEGVVKDVPAGWQYFTYSIPYNVSVPGWSQTHSGSSFTDAIGIAAGVSTAMKTAELTVIYTANTQNTHIKYVDANGTSVKTDTISGKTGTTQTVNSTVPTGWKMTTPQTIPTSVTFDDNGVPDTTITIEHDHVVVSHDKPQTTGTQIPNGATTAKFKGVGQSDLNKTITRTVTITSPDGKAKTTTQTFTSTRDAVVDMVDGSVVYSDWTQGKWAAVDVPTYDHYTASQTSVPEQTVDGSTADSTVNVTYTANAETVTVQWVDDTENGKVVYSTNVSLQPGKKTAVWVFGLDENRQASTDAVALSGMYNLVSVSDTNVLQSINWPGYYDVFDLVMPSVDNWIDGNTYTVHLTHKISATDGYSSPTKIALRTTNSKRYPNLMYTDDAAWSKTHKDVTRTVTVVKPDGSQSTTTQKLAFSRQAQYDMVTGEFKGYTDWKEGTQTFAAYTPAAIAGYTAGTVPTATVTGDYDNLKATVGYTANAQTAKIVYVDKDGNTIKTDTVNGVTDQTVDVKSTVPTGWKFVDGQKIPATIKLGVNTPDTKVIIEHDHVTVTPDKPQADGTDIPGGAAKFKGVAENDLNQTLTRTITVNDPHTGVKTITQTAKIYRDATADMVDGSVVYGDWSTAEWPEYIVPSVDGYTPSQATVEKKTVANGDKDDTVTIDYTADAQTAKIVYVDKDGNTIKTDTVNGVTDQDAKVNSSVPTGWKLIDGQTIPTTIKLGVNTPDTTIKVGHDHVSISHDKPQTDGTQIPNGATTFKGVSDSDLNQTLTRTITVNDPHTGVKTITQTAKIYRDAVVDMVDGSVVYGDWSTAEWPEYVVPTVNGYTPSQATVKSKTVANGDKDDTVTIDYTADKQTANVVYVDKDGNTIKTDTISGVTDQTVDVKSTVPTGWKLVDGQTIPTTIKLGVNTPDTKVIIEHDHVTVAPDKPQVDGTQIPNGAAKFKGVTDNDLNQTLTRTITVNDPHTGVKTIIQTAKIYRDAVVDMVDGSVIYGDWSTAEWPEYVVPSVDGYTPSQATVKSKAVANGDKDATVTIDYTADKQTAKIVYVDKDGNTIKTDTVTGVTDQDAKVNSSVPTGWKLVDGQTIPTTIKLGANTLDTKIIVEHNYVTITSDKPQADGTQIPNGAAKFKGVSDSDLNQTITRTINLEQPDGTVKTVKQEAKLTRNAVVDMIDGSVVYGDWSTGKWDAFDVPEIEHYTADQTQIAEQTVAVNDKDATVNISYTVNDETVTVQWIDDETGETLYSEAVTAKPNVTKPVYAYGVDANGKASDDMLYLQACYELVSVSDTSVLTLIDSTMSRYFDAYNVVFPSVDNWIDGNTYSVHLKHHVVTVSGMDNPTSEVFRNTNTARYPKLMFTEDAATDKTNHTVTRTIILHQPSGDKTVTQSADFERGANYDAVNGKFLGYTDWHGWPTTLSSYEVPTVAGYTASIQEVPSLEINGDSADQTVEVNYTANAQTAHVVYVDQNGNQIQSDDVDGHTDETVKVTSKVPAGWVLADGQSVPESITFGAVTPDAKVVVKHGHITVTPDAPKTSNDKLPDNPGQSYPSGVDYNDLNKTITRTINVHNLDGTIMPIVQTAHLTRTADVDEVDGTVTYGEWTTGSWDKFVSTPIDGYTASLTELPATEVGSATADTSFDVIYTANSQSMRINYVDENGQTVDSTIVNGHTDETVTTNSKVPAGWKLVDGQSVPKEITFKGAKTDDVTVKVEHAHVTVTPDAPKTASDKLPDNADKNYPSGVGYDDLNKTITRAIEIDEPNGNIIFVPKQEVHYTRTADVDEVSETVTYGKWTTKDQFAEFTDVPVFAGYTPSQAKVDAVVPNIDDSNSTVKITYAANEQSMQIVYVDENGQTVKADTVKGHTDETVATNSTIPAGWTTESAVPTEITFKGAKTADVTIKVKHAHVTVTPDAPKTVSDKLPDNVDKNYPSGVDYNNLNKTVKRTIVVHNVDGTTTTVEQKVHFTRTADVDEVDGTVEYGSWQADKQFDQYAVPVVPGYVSMIDGKEQTMIQPETPNVDDNDLTIDVTYQAVDGSQTIDYVDENNTVIGYQIITGKTAETKPVKSAVPAGWKLVDGQTVPATVTIKANDVPVKVSIEHDHVAVSYDNAQKDGTRIPNGAAVFNGVADNDLNQTLTRTITINDPHEGVKTITQTAKIYRDAVVDMVNGSVVYGEWSTAEWPEYTVPMVDGYTPNQATVESKAVANGDKDDAVTIDYTANEQTAKIVYVDENGQTVKSDTVTGVTDQDAKVDSSVPTGWKLIDGQTIPATIKLGVNTPDATIKVEHDHVSISHDNPQANGTDIPGGVAKFNGVADNDLNQTLTRTITVNDPHTGVKTITQTAKIYRDAVVDMVDGTVKYGEWLTAEWPEYTIPTVDGYTPSQATVAEKQVANGDQNANVVVDYTADKQTAKIVYVDENGQTVKTDTVAGVTDQDAKVDSSVPTGWKLIDGQTIPTTIKLGVDTPDTVVKVQHDHVSISHDKSQTNGTDIPGGAAKFNGVSDTDLNQVLTRTITVNDPHEGVKTTVQTAKLYRDAVVDMVDGSVVYGDWSTAEWPEYVTPIIAGYTPSQATVESKTVVNGDKDDAVMIDYTADQQTAKIVYVDENGQTVKTDTVNGKTDQDVKVDSSVPTGWKLVDGQTIPTMIKLGVNTPDTVVKVQHNHVSINHDKPQVNGTDIPGGTAKFNNVDNNDLNQTLTRTITINDPHEGVKTITQTAKIYRDAVVDMVDGAVKYGEWSTAEWPEYIVPTVDGYTPSQKIVEKKTVANGDQDDAVTTDYTADQQTAKIVYVDKDGNTIKTDTVSGVTDQTIDTNSSVPTGWKLIDGQTIPTTIKLGVNTPDTTIKVEHDHVSISHDKPQADGTNIPGGTAKFNGVANNDLNQVLTRTITVNDPHEGVKTITQTAKIYRNAVVDMVDGTVKYGEWSTAEWPEYTVPTVDGYTPSQTVVEKKSVANGDQDANVVVDYTADKQTAKIVYVDENGNAVKTDSINGVTDQTVDTNSSVPTGWKLIDGQMIPTTIKLGVNTPDTVVKVEHDHVSIGHDNSQTNGTDIPGGTAKFNGVADNDLNQTLTRTITINDPHEGAKTITQAAKIYRDAVVDMVDGSVVYGKWSTAEWPEYTVPTVDGYTPSQTVVEKKSVANGDKNVNAVIDYTADDQTAKIVYVDENGKTVKADTVSGKTDQIVDVNSSVPTGWKLVDGQMVPATIKLGVNTPDTMVKVEHDHVSISHDNPQADGTDIPGGTAKFNDVADNDLNQTLTRTIIVKLPNGQTKALAQTAKLYRDAVVDMVDGSVVYGDWSTAQWNEYTVPDVDGYTPSQKTIVAKPVVNGIQNETVTIDYTANDGTQTINYVDEDGNVIVKQTVHGKTDQKVVVNDDKPYGWVLEDGQTVPGTVTIKAADEPITVKIKHGIVTIAPDVPKTDADRMPNWPDKGYPAGVGYDDLNKTVTRTITFELPDGQTKTVKQTTTFTRHATVDEVTNAVVYSAWNEQSHTFDAVDVPTIDGWTSSVEQVDGTVVTPDSEDEQVTIAYTANPTAPKSEDKPAATAGQSEGTADTANGSANTAFNESATVQGNAKAGSRIKANSQAKTDELPQTGNEQTNLQAIAGLAMTGLAAMLGLGRKKRKNS